MINFKKTTIKELHEKLISKEITSAQLVEESKSIIAKKNGDINAIIEVFDDTVTPGNITEKSSLLAGIPAVVKDNMLFKGKTVTSASNILDEYKATYNSKIAEIFTESEISLVGRANMDDSAMGTSTEVLLPSGLCVSCFEMEVASTSAAKDFCKLQEVCSPRADRPTTGLDR